MLSSANTARRANTAAARRGMPARSASRLYTMGSCPRELSVAMAAAGVRRGAIHFDAAAQRSVATHPVLQPLADWANNDEVDHDAHEGAFLEAHPSGALFGAFCWRTVRGQACGGVRLRPYETVDSYMRDGLRLAIGMGRKSALAGLWWGGGKGVIAQARPARIRLFGRRALLTPQANPGPRSRCGRGA